MNQPRQAERASAPPSRGLVKPVVLWLLLVLLTALAGPVSKTFGLGTSTPLGAQTGDLYQLKQQPLTVWEWNGSQWVAIPNVTALPIAAAIGSYYNLTQADGARPAGA